MVHLGDGVGIESSVFQIFQHQFPLAALGHTTCMNLHELNYHTHTTNKLKQTCARFIYIYIYKQHTNRRSHSSTTHISWWSWAGKWDQTILRAPGCTGLGRLLPTQVPDAPELAAADPAAQGRQAAEALADLICRVILQGRWRS